MPTTTNLALPYPAGSDNPEAPVLQALVAAADVFAGPWVDYTPTLSQGAGISVTKIVAKYRFVGKVCEWYFVLLLNANGTAGQPVLVTLPPIAPKYTTTDAVTGAVEPEVQGTVYQLVRPSGSTTQARVQAFAGNYTTQLVTTNLFRGWGQHEVT